MTLSCNASSVWFQWQGNVHKSLLHPNHTETKSRGTLYIPCRVKLRSMTRREKNYPFWKVPLPSENQTCGGKNWPMIRIILLTTVSLLYNYIPTSEMECRSKRRRGTGSTSCDLHEGRHVMKGGWIHVATYGGFLKWWVSQTTTFGFPTKNGPFWGGDWGYHHFRKHPYYKHTNLTIAIVVQSFVYEVWW